MEKKIGMYSKEDGSLVMLFTSARQAAKYLGDTSKEANIKKCLKGLRANAYGYIWVDMRELNHSADL